MNCTSKDTIDVSVVIPCYNADDTLKRSLKSIQAQTVLPREIIIVDDGSEIPLETLKAELIDGITIPIIFVEQENLGAPAARNAGISVAKTKFIALLDADDIWLPKKLEIQHRIMVDHGFHFTGHGYDFVFNHNTKVESLEVRSINKFEFIFYNPYFTPTVMFRREYFKGFDYRFRRVDDYKAWVENYNLGKFGYINLVLASGFKHPIGHSGLTQSVRTMHEAYMIVLKTLLQEKSIGFLFYIFALFVEKIKLPLRFLRSRCTQIHKRYR